MIQIYLIIFTISFSLFIGFLIFLFIMIKDEYLEKPKAHIRKHWDCGD